MALAADWLYRGNSRMWQHVGEHAGHGAERYQTSLAPAQAPHFTRCTICWRTVSSTWRWLGMGGLLRAEIMATSRMISGLISGTACKVPLRISSCTDTRGKIVQPQF